MPELKFDVDKQFDETLAALVRSNKDAKTKADVVQRAVATYSYLRSGLPAGAKIQILDDKGQVLYDDVQVP